jgi:signal transduction histidine kinase
LTAIVISGLWFVVDYLVRDTSQTLITTFAQMLQGQEVSSENITEQLEDVRFDRFWPIMVIATAVILSFGFIMVYIALTPARRSFERKKRFVSNISHELRTPLAVMRTNTDVALLDKEIPPKVRDILKRNLIEFDRVSDIMNNLLGLSNLMRDGQVQFEDIDLNTVAKRAVDTLAEIENSKDLTISLKSRTEKTVVGNASALEQVVFNLACQKCDCPH